MKPLRILAIDDDPLMLALYREYLGSDGHIVETASDGAAGLARFKDAQWDLVLTDRSMPKLNGEQVAAAVKGISPLMPVVMVSGSVDEMPRGVGGTRIVDMLVHKPFTLTELVETITKVSGGKEP